MLVFPNAKINLGLNVLSKRPDGYHDIITALYPIPVYDVLEIVEADKFSFRSEGLSIPGASEENLCVKAYQALQTAGDLPPVGIILYKNIPMGAGLGGGSADGAFTLKLLNQMFKLGLSPQRLEELALDLGSDCPFFVSNQPALAQGRGELLKALDLDLVKLYFLLVIPELKISTSEAYRAITPHTAEQELGPALSADLASWRGGLLNDFESYVFKKDPLVGTLKEQLYGMGAIYAAMSGSGSAVYGLFEALPEIPADLSKHTLFTGSLDPKAL